MYQSANKLNLRYFSDLLNTLSLADLLAAGSYTRNTTEAIENGVYLATECACNPEQFELKPEMFCCVFVLPCPTHGTYFKRLLFLVSDELEMSPDLFGKFICVWGAHRAFHVSIILLNFTTQLVTTQ